MLTNILYTYGYIDFTAGAVYLSPRSRRLRTAAGPPTVRWPAYLTAVREVPGSIPTGVRTGVTERTDPNDRPRDCRRYR